MFLHNRVRYLSVISASLKQLRLNVDINLSCVYRGNQIAAIKSHFYHSKVLMLWYK